jgi:hypothetical protein
MVAQQTEFEIPESAEERERFPLRKDFSAAKFAEYLSGYEFRAVEGPAVTCPRLNVRVGKRIRFRMVVRDDGTVNRRASLARMLVKRTEVERDFDKGHALEEVY